jgi:hypothetical protein
MPHLTLDALARLADEPPGPDEAIHLTECRVCRDGLGAIRSQAADLRRLPALAPPPDEWDRIEQRLRTEAAADSRRARTVGRLARFAAAIVLVTLGAATHAWFTRPTDPIDAGSVARPLTLDDAIARVRAAELVYRRSLLDYSSIARPEPPRDFVARLATLDAIVLTTRTALERAPADPVINSYHLSALAERENLLDLMR